MTIIKPFRGYRYNPKTVGDLSKAITPPYDVINKKQQASYYKVHPYNFIRLDLGKTHPSDDKNAPSSICRKCQITLHSLSPYHLFLGSKIFHHHPHYHSNHKNHSELIEVEKSYRKSHNDCSDAELTSPGNHYS